MHFPSPGEGINNSPIRRRTKSRLFPLEYLLRSSTPRCLVASRNSTLKIEAHPHPLVSQSNWSHEIRFIQIAERKVFRRVFDAPPTNHRIIRPHETGGRSQSAAELILQPANNNNLPQFTVIREQFVGW